MVIESILTKNDKPHRDEYEGLRMSLTDEAVLAVLDAELVEISATRRRGGRGRGG